jgi:hypothetical protein
VKYGVMSRTIRLSVKARGASDSPTVDDLLDQLRDWFELLKGVEEAVAEDGTQAIEWRIISASTNSPINFEAAPFPKEFAVNIERRAELVTRQAAYGLRQLQTSGERPSYFTNKVLVRAEKLFERVTNGLEQTTVDFGPDLPALDLTPKAAREAVTNTRSVLEPKNRPYKEQGAVEGYAQSIERDGWGRPIFWIRDRRTSESVKCFVTGAALDELETHQIRDVWRNRRVQVYGLLHYKGLGQLTQIEAISVRFLRDRRELPDISDIADETFTGGLRSEEYLDRIRDGSLS